MLIKYIRCIPDENGLLMGTVYLRSIQTYVVMMIQFQFWRGRQIDCGKTRGLHRSNQGDVQGAGSNR